MRYRLRTLMVVVTVIGAFFAGRQSVMPLLKEQERQSALERDHNRLLEGQVRSLEKSKAIRISVRGGGRGSFPPVEAEPGIILLGPATPPP